MVNQALQFSNRLLAGLPTAEYQHFLIQCETVELVVGDVISNRDDPIHFVYFPFDSIISLLAPIEGSRGMEVAMIGNEGMFGITLMLGVHTTPWQALVQKGGSALRVSAPLFLRFLERSALLHSRLNLYLCVAFSQLIQSAICNRFHYVEERLARLLLMIRDRAHSETFYITQDLLSHMLGVRRVGVTKAAVALQHKSLISYRRGHVLINDSDGLEAASCNCYKIDQETYERILQGQELQAEFVVRQSGIAQFTQELPS